MIQSLNMKTKIYIIFFYNKFCTLKNNFDKNIFYISLKSFKLLTRLSIKFLNSFNFF